MRLGFADNQSSSGGCTCSVVLPGHERALNSQDSHSVQLHATVMPSWEHCNHAMPGHVDDSFKLPGSLMMIMACSKYTNHCCSAPWQHRPTGQLQPLIPNTLGMMLLTLYSLRAFLGSVPLAGSSTGARNVAGRTLPAPCELLAQLPNHPPQMKKVWSPARHPQQRAYPLCTR
jgi:hypothetical protein